MRMSMTSVKDAFSRHRAPILVGSAVTFVAATGVAAACWFGFMRDGSESRARGEVAISTFRQLAASQNGHLAKGQQLTLNVASKPVTATYQGTALDVEPDTGKPAICHIVQTKVEKRPAEFVSFGCRSTGPE